MTAKAQGKNQVVLYDEDGARRPDAPGIERDVRSIAHLKMLQSLTGRLNRLNDVREIGDAIAAELRSLVDYHNCRVFVADGDELIPVAFLGDLTSGMDSLSLDILRKRVGEGVTGRCAELGESIVVADAANCEFGQLIEGTDPIEESLLAVPLRYGSRVVGVIVVSKLGLNQFDEDDVRLLEVLAGHAAVAVENAQPVRVGAARGRERDVAARVRPGAGDARRARRHRGAGDRALRGDPRQPQHVLLSRDGRRAHGCTPSTGTRRRRPRSSPRGPCRSTALDVDRDPYIAEPQRLRAGDRTRSARSRRPLRGRAVRRRRPRRVASSRSSSGRTSGSASSRCSAASRSRRSSRSPMPRATRGSSGRSSPPSRRSPTRSRRTTSTRPTHARWITDLSLRVGRELGLDERALKCLELGALLHDIGKIGIPSDVLSKPGRLTAAERKLVQTHPELGERIIAPIDRLQAVRPIVRHCHERWDGRGYPDGVAGEDIPLESRIIFVCDAYHAMTTDRPYRRRLSHREAVRRLAEGAGSQFDPHVVEVALRVLEQRARRPSRRPRAPARRPRACGRDGGTGRRPRAARARCRAG